MLEPIIKLVTKTKLIIASSTGGLVNTVIEYALPDSVIGFAMIGKIPQKEGFLTLTSAGVIRWRKACLR